MENGTLAGRLRRLLNERGLSQRAFAILAGLTPAAVNKYLTGARLPDAETLIKISKGLDVSVDYLLMGIDGPSVERLRADLDAVLPNLSSEEKMELMKKLLK